MAERLRAATELLGEIALDPSVLEVLTEKERIQLVNNAGDVFSPSVELRRQRVRARQRRERAEKLQRDEDVLDQHRDPPAAGEAGLHHAERVPARGVRSGNCGRRSRGSRDGGPPALLRLQAEVHAGPPLLRPALPVVRGAQLREAHRDRRSAGPGRAAHRRTGEDRLPGRHQAAARRCVADRDDPVPARLRTPVLPGGRLRRVG